MTTAESSRKAKKIRYMDECFKRAEAWESSTRSIEKENKRFAHADPDHPEWQWPQNVYNQRNMPGENRPCIVVNKVRQHNLQVVNDGRENKPSITIHATGFGATSEAADVFEGLIRHIEYQSKAGAVYVKAQTDQVDFGVGYMRVVTEYPPDDSFDQEIYIRAINDAHSVYMDPDAQQADKSDARWCFVFRDLPRKEFETEFPQYKDIAGAQSLDGKNNSGWVEKDTVRVCEYYERHAKTDTLWAVPQDAVHPGHPGGTVRESDITVDGLPEALRDAEKNGTPGYQSRDVENIIVKWTLRVGDEIVDEQDTAYNSIPVVGVYGEEIVIDGKYYRIGHTNSLKDAQRLYNYNASAAVEFGALQGKTPWLVDPRAIEGYETYWNTANSVNHAYLPHNVMSDSGQADIPVPERIAPPNGAPIYLEAMQLAEQQMMIASGQYQAQMGAEGNERTGIAIQERQRQGDKATYHFIDNLGIAIAYLGRILVDLVPKVYDTKRVVQILGEDGTRTQVQIDPGAPTAHVAPQPNAGGAPPAPGQPNTQPVGPPPPQGQAPGQQAGQGAAPDAMLIFNPTIGKYAVEAEIGPGFATQREASANAFTQIMAANPSAMQLYGDLYFKSQDFPLADEAAERAHNMLPPQALGGPSAETQQLQQHLQQTQNALTAAMKELADEKMRSKLANDNKSNNNSIDAYKAETDRIAALHDINPELLRPLVSQLVIQALADKYGGSTNVMPVTLPHPNETPINTNVPPGADPAAANDPTQPQQGMAQ